MYRHDFRALQYPIRIYSGKDALKNLPSVLQRQGARRAFVVCGRSVSRNTPLVSRIRDILGHSLVGVYDEMEKESPLPAVLAARDAAHAAGADLLIGVGAGSVLQATRVIAILLAETRPPEELITQYPDDGRVISPKLLAPKLPIVNVLTAATTAQNRSGSAVKNEKLDHRMEFYDPKTRPVAVFWDSEALLTAPASLAVATGVGVFWWAVMNVGGASMTPLVEGDRLQALRLATGALTRSQDMSDAAARIEMCAAAFLMNRDVDDGGALTRHWVERVVYAFAAALFNLHPQVRQGEANSALTPAVVRKMGHRDPEAMCRIAAALGVWRDGDPILEAPERAASALERIFKSIGLPTRVAELGIPSESLPTILEHSLKNYNSDPKREFVREKELLWEVLQATW